MAELATATAFTTVDGDSAAASEKPAADAALAAARSETGGDAPAGKVAKKTKDMRLVALRRFAFAITFLNVLGHFYLGFEQSWAQPLVALLAAYSVELLLEWVDSRVKGKAPRFAGSLANLFHFLLPAHITALACAMLLYANDRLWPLVFAVTVAMGSKWVLRVPMKGRLRHFMNPSNTGISITLICFPWVGIAPPYMFTENLFGWQDWALPAIIIVSGSILNAKLTRRMPLIFAWLGGFAAQALVRTTFFDLSLSGALMPMTGVAFLLFTFYMVTDPATTPFNRKGQVLFGLSVGAAYGLLMANQIVFGLFFGLTAVCVVRGVLLWVRVLADARAERRMPVPASASMAAGR